MHVACSVCMHVQTHLARTSLRAKHTCWDQGRERVPLFAHPHACTPTQGRHSHTHHTRAARSTVPNGRGGSACRLNTLSASRAVEISRRRCWLASCFSGPWLRCTSLSSLMLLTLALRSKSSLVAALACVPPAAARARYLGDASWTQAGTYLPLYLCFAAFDGFVLGRYLVETVFVLIQASTTRLGQFFKSAAKFR